MTSALVIGGHGTGVSTFLGLLYTAEVRLGSEVEDEFRFHVDRETIRRLEGIYGELGDGRFPESEVDWALKPLTFLFASRRFGRGRGRPPGSSPDAEFDPHRVEIGGLTTDEAAELGGRDVVLDGVTRRLLRSRLVLPIIDATALADPGAEPGSRIAAEDRRLSLALDLVVRFVSAERKRRARRLFPLFVLTKSDRLSPGVSLRLGAPSGPLAGWAPEARRAFGEKVQATYLPDTSRVLARARDRGVEVAPSVWFFSELGTEGVREERIRRRWRSPSGGWEPEYSFEEYRALLYRLGDLAHRLPASNDD